MKLYLDSAHPTEWKAVVDRGWTRSVTCNPLILEAAGWPVTLDSCAKLVEHAAQTGLVELHLQAWPDAHGDWLPVAQQLSDLAPWVVVKLPAIAPAMRAAMQLKQQQKNILITAISNPLHALWASQIGADYAAPYVGRLNEAGRDATDLLKCMVNLQHRNGPRVLAASVRNLEVVSQLIQMDVAAATLRFDLFRQAEQDPQALSAVEQFESARSGSALGKPQDYVN